MMNEITILNATSTVKSQKVMKYTRAKFLLVTRVYILQVMNQLFTTMMWNSVTNELIKSLKFIK